MLNCKTNVYRSKQQISSKNLPQLKAELLLYLQQKSKIYCKALKRHAHLSKLPDAITERKDAKRRLQRFLVAIDILAKEKTYKQKCFKKHINYAITGLDANNEPVFVHIREEITQKDRILYFVSCY